MSDSIAAARDADEVYGTCEVINCSAKARRRIGVKVGKLGKIFLFVCNDCQHKFQDQWSEEWDCTVI